MSNSISKGLQILIFLSFGLLILWWLYKDVDPEELISIIKKDVDYRWIILSVFIGLLSHIIRTIRWQMLIEPVDRRPGLINTFLSVMIGYLANLAIPRMGEISRCAIISKYEKLSFSRTVGTVVTERILDFVMLLVSLGLMIVLQYNVFRELIQDKIDLSGMHSFFSSIWVAIFIVIIISTLLFYRKAISESKIFFKIKSLWKKFSEGLLSYRRVKNKFMFFVHTVFIFVLYFLMIYVCFFGFPFTKDLGLGAGLSVFVLGNLGMVAPVQGGTGPWHFMVISSLIFFGVQAPQAAAFALLVHGSINGMIIVLGLFSLIVLPIYNKK